MPVTCLRPESIGNRDIFTAGDLKAALGESPLPRKQHAERNRLHYSPGSIRFRSLDVVVTPGCLSTGCGLSTQVSHKPSTGTPQDGCFGVTGVTQGIVVTHVVGIGCRV